MMRFVIPIILIGIVSAFFFVVTNPMYNDLLTLNTEVASYNNVLDNAKTLEMERDKLTLKYNAITSENLTKLQKLLPENVDNVRLILEIGQIALPYGMVLKDVKYNITETKTPETLTAKGTVIQGGVAAKTLKDYGIFGLEFSTVGTYDNFINFTKDLESNLRIVDISAITFSSDTGNPVNNLKTNSSEIYKYNFKIKTYWLKIKMPKIKNIIIFIIIAVAFILIYIFVIKPSFEEKASLSSSSTNSTLPNMDGSTPNTNTSSANSLATKDFLALFSGVKNIKLNNTIFSDPAFNGLRDSSIILIPDGTEGRVNPFAQFGNDAVPAVPPIIPTPVKP